MVGVIDGFRWALLRGDSGLSISDLLSSICITVVLLVSGIWYFRKMERTFADVI
jgi:lipopolysaccharide transport system permease protein